MCYFCMNSALKAVFMISTLQVYFPLNFPFHVKLHTCQFLLPQPVKAKLSLVRLDIIFYISAAKKMFCSSVS